MKYYYVPKFVIAYDTTLESQYILEDTTIASSDAKVFTKTTLPKLPNASISIDKTGLHNWPHNMYNGYANQAVTFNGDYELTSNGAFDRAGFADFINGHYVLLTRHCLYTSTDRINWTEYKLPNYLDNMKVIYTRGTINVVSSNYFSLPITSPVVRPDLSKRDFKLPPDFDSISVQADNDMYGSNGKAVAGYICKDGWWSPKPIDYLTQGSWDSSSYMFVVKTWGPEYDKVNFNTSKINSMTEFMELNTHWDPLAYNPYEQSYTGYWANDCPIYQIVCCNDGLLKYRLIREGQNPNTNVVPFASLNINTTSHVLSSFQFKFTYDTDTYNQAQNLFKQFEGRYVITASELYSLNWNGVEFTADVIAGCLGGNIISIQYEYKSKWRYQGTYWADYIVGPEVHRLHVYCDNGTYILIDASDKLQPANISSHNTGFNFNRAIYDALDGKTAFITYTNDIYKQTSYDTFEYLITMNEEIIGISTSDSGYTICTVAGSYQYSTIFGLSNPIRYEFCVPQIEYNTYDTWEEQLVLSTGYIDFTNGHYILISNIGKIYFSYDLVNWTYVGIANAIFYTGVMNPRWMYFNGTYIVKGADYWSYLDLSTGIMSPGLNSTVTTKTMGIPLKDKFLFYNYGNCAAIYEPSNPTYGLKLPILNMPAENVNAPTEVFTEISRMSFSVYNDAIDPNMTFDFVGKSQGVYMYLEYSPFIPGDYHNGRTGLFYSGNNDAPNVDSVNLRRGYTLNTTATPGILTCSIVICKSNWRPTVLDITLLNIKLNNVPIMFNQFDQITYSITGLAWRGIVSLPLQYYSQNDPIITSIANAVTDSDGNPYPVQFALFYDALYMVKYIKDSYYGTLYVASIEKYNYNTGLFTQVTDQIILDMFVKYPLNNTDRYMIKYMGNNQNFCVGVSNDGKYIAVNNGVITIDQEYPMRVKGIKQIYGLDYNNLVLGEKGLLVVYHARWRWYTKIQLDATKRLLNGIQFSYTLSNVSYERTIIIGSNGYLAYTDNIGGDWQTTQLGSTDLVDIAITPMPMINGTMHQKILVVGKQGSIYYSNDSGNSWQALSVTSSDINCIVYHPATGKFVIAGDMFIAVSTDLFTWNVIVTGLTFICNTATEFFGTIMLGCKEGKLISSTDTYNWSYVVSNTAADIKHLYTAYNYTGYYGPNYWYIGGELYPSTIPLTDGMAIGEKFFWLSGSHYNVITDQYDETWTEVTITDKNNSNLFHMTPPYTTQGYYGPLSINLCKQLTWTDIYKIPNIKMFSDANCTTEITDTLYVPIRATGGVSYGMTSQPSMNEFIFTFDTDVDVSKIIYMSLWLDIRIVSESKYQDWYGQWHTQVNEVKQLTRQVTMPVTSRDLVNNTITVTGFEYPLPMGYILLLWPGSVQSGTPYTLDKNRANNYCVGIPSNSIYASFKEDPNECEVLTTSVWFKNFSTDKIYDNLLILSRSIYGQTKFSFKEYVTSTLLPDASKIHNASIVNYYNLPITNIGFKRCIETMLVEPNLHLIYLPSTLETNILADTSKILYRGLVIDIQDLKYIEVDEVTLSSYDPLTNQMIQGYVHQATANLSNKHYATDIWTYTTAANNYQKSYGAILVKAEDIKTLNATVSYSIGDNSGDGYIYIRCVTGTFLELQDLQADLLINGCHFSSAMTYNQNNTRIAVWYYLSPTLIKVLPYRERGQYWSQITYQVNLPAFTGILQYVVASQTFDYTSEALQPMYQFDAGTLEFNIDQFPTVWKKAYDLPAISGTDPLKVNIRQNRVVNGVKYMAFNVVRLSGVEYNI